MPEKDKNFGGSLVLDFRKWWRHVKTIYRIIVAYHGDNPNTRNGARLRSPSPIMAPDYTYDLWILLTS